MPSQGRSWYQNLVACECNLEDMMAGSHVEDISKKDRGRDLGPPTRGRKDKSCDAISSFKGRIAKLELGVVDTKGDVDLLERHIEEAMGIYWGRSRTFKRGCKARRFTWCYTRSSWLFKTRS